MTTDTSGPSLLVLGMCPPGAYPNRETEETLTSLEASGQITLSRVPVNGLTGPGQDGEAETSGGRVVWLDLRAGLVPGWLDRIRQELDAAPGCVIACLAYQKDSRNPSRDVPGEDGELRDGGGYYTLLQDRGPVLLAAWDQAREGVGNAGRRGGHHILLEAMLRAGAGRDLRLVAGGALLQPGMPSIRPTFQQQAYDEASALLEQAMLDLVAHRLPAFPLERLQRDHALQARKLGHLLGRLQQGEEVTGEELSRTGFIFVLLAMALGDIQSARDVMETLFSLVSEQPGLMRLYKLLASRHPIPGRAPSLSVQKRKVSVVVPLFNQGHYLEEAVRSVLRQTHQEWEMLIIDDGSTDDSLEQASRLVDSLADSRISLVTQNNRGKGATRNRGIRETSGEVVVTLDSDDLLAPDYFSVGLDLLDRDTRAGWVTPRTLVFGRNNHVAWQEEYDLIQALVRSPSPSSAMLRRVALEEAGLFREDMSNREDTEMWLALAELGWTGVTSRDPLFLYRHAFQRPGLRDISNIASKEELVSLHPWWFRVDLDRETRRKAYLEHKTVLFPLWFMNMKNLERVAPVWRDRDRFLALMAEIRSEYGPVDTPRRWDRDTVDPHLKVRESLYGVRSDGD